ncbi:hypothetical protein V8G54_018433 [Vigna mungo]|uniref:Uncharacterized protein n=1 Tax=Vigna mungo TaxID=3915 RepID=A0AAQ3RSP0_VIGMU
MKKRAWSPLVMWVMVIWLYGLLSIAASSKSNGTTSLCDASVEDCLLDSWLPTISSSHFRRVLDDKDKYSSLKTGNRNKPAAIIDPATGRYKNSGPGAGPGQPSCRNAYYRCTS